MKKFIELYEALEKGEVELEFGLCQIINNNLPLKKSFLIDDFFIDWFQSNDKLEVFISPVGQWDSTRKNLLLLLACYDNEI